MHQIIFRLGSAPDSASPDLLAGFKGPTSKERGERSGKWSEGRGPSSIFLRIYAHVFTAVS